MGNIVTYEARPDLRPIQMSNGTTQVFVAALALAASGLAETNRQREFAVWFASHDQGIFGLGIVGFDVGGLPWSPNSFVGDCEFVLRVIDAAKARSGWERLGYEPSGERLLPCLDQFRTMAEAFSIGHTAESEADVWTYERPARLVLCPLHRVYQHEHGCVLCNDR